jgi:hypothetical protein
MSRTQACLTPTYLRVLLLRRQPLKICGIFRFDPLCPSRIAGKQILCAGGVGAHDLWCWEIKTHIHWSPLYLRHGLCQVYWSRSRNIPRSIDPVDGSPAYAESRTREPALSFNLV